MNTSEAVLDLVDLLGRRREILSFLVEEPRDKRTIADELDIPRSTLDRAVRELEAVGLVEYTGEDYTITSIGERLTRRFVRFQEWVEITLAFEPFLHWVPVNEFDFDLRCLLDAELVLPEPNDPFAILNRHVETLRKVSKFYGMRSFIGLHAFETGHRQVVENGAHHELIVESDVAETLQSKECYASKFRQLRDHDGFTISVYDGSIPYFVGVFDEETVQIGVDENREPRALIETDRPEVRAWANDTIERYKQDAVTLPQPPSPWRTQAVRR